MMTVTMMLMTFCPKLRINQTLRTFVRICHFDNTRHSYHVSRNTTVN